MYFFPITCFNRFKKTLHISRDLLANPIGDLADKGMTFPAELTDLFRHDCFGCRV